MSKMMKAEVKVVRFGCADVIATSSLVNGRNYYTLGEELIQSGEKLEPIGDTQRSFISTDRYSFTYNDNKIAVDTIDVRDNSYYYYAWYNDGAWYTQHIPYSSSYGKEWKVSINGESYY